MKIFKSMFLLVLSISAPSLHAETQYIMNVNVVPMGTPTVLENQVVVITDGYITAIGPAALLRPGEGKKIDGTGKYLLPAWAEMHAHVPGLSANVQYTQDVLNLYLANGITTIRGMLGQPSHLKLRELLAEGDMTGPRLITSGPSFNGNSVSSPEQAREKVRAQKAAGYDFLKLHPGLERDEYIAIVETAHEVGIDYAGHVSVGVGIPLTLESRQVTIDHLDGYAQLFVPTGHDLHGVSPQFFGINLSSGMGTDEIEQWAKATRDAGVWNVPTQSLMENIFSGRSTDDLLARPEMEYMRPGTISNWSSQVVSTDTDIAAARQFLMVRRALIKALNDEGAGLLLGSDAPQIMNVPGFSIHEELEFLVNAGLSPYEALKTGTVNVAAFYSEEDRGQVAPGYVADVVLLDANPLENISNTRKIDGVMHNGIWYDRVWLNKTLDGIRDRKV